MGRGRLALIAVIISLSALWAQQTTTPPKLEPRPAGPENVQPNAADRRITLDIQVTDQHGQPVRGLKRQDFTLLDDNQPQNILSFQEVGNAGVSSDDTPAEIVLVVDAVNTPFSRVADEREEIRKFLLRNDGQLAQPVSLIVFSGSGTKIQNAASRDGKALATLYDQYETGLRSSTRSQGFYGATERFSTSISGLSSLANYEAARPGRKLMIWFSPGWPLLSGSRVELTDKTERQLFDSVVSLSDKLRQARITLYDVDPSGVANAGRTRSVYYETFVKGVTSASKVQAGNLSLQVLAVQSGGNVFNTGNDLTEETLNCTADAQSFYVLSFSGHPGDQANEYHSIAVKVDEPGTSIRTRAGYYAQP
jgi:VWFA-related protein